jgi:hypothetical protein
MSGATEKLVPASPTGRPAMPAEAAELYDTWFEPNGIMEFLPEDCVVRVDAKAGTITYTSFVWNDGVARGYNGDIAATCDKGLSARVWRIARDAGLGGEDVILEQRTVPLLAPVTDRVRRLFASPSVRRPNPVGQPCGPTLVEV